MKINKQHVEWVSETNNILHTIEDAGRVCYKSVSTGNHEEFIRRLIDAGHLSVLEHGNITMRIVTDRGISHEWVRHRLCAYSQESTRYCNYSKGKFGNEITVVPPSGIDKTTKAYDIWFGCMQNIEKVYMGLLDVGYKPEIARSVLPTCLKTEFFVTANIRQWRYMIGIRANKKAHPMIRELMHLAHKEIEKRYPVLVYNLSIDEK